uniref:Pre-mRNA-splicing factor 38 n=1 Tax=Lotharella oceanica TaxID=641309 RepID=A0A7S2TQ56_9EUKA
MPRDGLNTTVSDAESIKGTNPQFLIEKITRMKIYECMYWKEHCFALNAEGIVDKAVDLKYVGGVTGGNRHPSEFLCLLLKMLQIQPEKSIILEFILNDDYKYVRILGATYLRLTGQAIEIYQYLEPLLNDLRKIRYKNVEAKFEIKHVDEIVDNLLVGQSAFDIMLPRIPLRWHLELAGKLQPRKSALEEMDLFDDEEEQKGGKTEEFLDLKKTEGDKAQIGWKDDGAKKDKGSEDKDDSDKEDEDKGKSRKSKKTKEDEDDDEDDDEEDEDDRDSRDRSRRRRRRNDSRDRSRSRDRRRRSRDRRDRDRRRRRRDRSDSRDRRRRRR